MVCTVHDFMNEFYFDHEQLYKKLSLSDKLTCHYFRILSRFAATKSDKILYVTYSIAQEAKRRYHVSPHKQVVAHNAVLPIPSHGRCSYIPASEPHVILYVAAFHSHKGHREALLVFSEMLHLANTRNMKIKLCFRGHIRDKQYHADLLDLIAEKSLAPYVEFIPFEKDHSVETIYSKASATMLLSQYEGFGLPLIESQTAGVPVVCSSIAVFREILGESAVYVNGERPLDAAQKLLGLISDPNLREEFVRRGHLNVERFSWSHTARNTVQAYLGAVADE
jgi:glycosyltransferase involved in cell wall biosynthesis